MQEPHFWTLPWEPRRVQCGLHPGMPMAELRRLVGTHSSQGRPPRGPQERVIYRERSAASVHCTPVLLSPLPFTHLLLALEFLLR